MLDIEKNSMPEWKQWIQRIEEMPCAAFAILNDTDMTLLAANHTFYQVLGCTEKDMRLKYGGRLATLLSVEALKNFANVPVGKVSERIFCRLQAKRNGTDIWLEAGMLAYGTEDGVVLCCTAADVTAYELRQQELLSLEETVRIAAAQAGADYFEYDAASDMAHVRSACCVLPKSMVDVGGESPQFLERLLAEDIILPKYKDALRDTFKAAHSGEGKAVCELQLHSEERGVIWTRLSMTLKPGKLQVVGLLEDITQEKGVALNYLNETQFYQAILLERAAYAHVNVTCDRIERIGGMWNLYNEIIDKVSYTQLIQEFINKVVHPDDREQYLEIMQCSNFIESLENGIDRLGCEFRRIVDQNKMMWMQLNVYLFRSPLTSHIYALLAIKNIDDQKKQELLLLRASRLDQLTNMYNKTVSEALVRENLAEADESEICAFVILDVDDFKQVNDQRGHQEGDQVLVRLADIMSHTFRKSDVIGRFGGDEFIIFLQNVGSVEQVKLRMEDLYRQLREDIHVGAISCSAGVAIAQGKVDYEQIFTDADTALYHAKAAGKNQYNIHLSGLSMEHMEFENRIPSQPRTRAEGSLPSGDPAPQPTPVVKSTPSRSFDSFMAEQGDIAYLVDSDTFELLCGNKAFYDRVGMSEAQCTRMKCYELMHKRDTPCPFCSKANWSSDKFYLWRNLNQALEQEFLIKNRLVTWAGREVLLAIAVDISNNKSIVDSMENGAMEAHSILSGVQHMAEAQTLAIAMDSAMETIGSFFRADAVRLWRRENNGTYSSAYAWSRTSQVVQGTVEQASINNWLVGRSWEQPVILESPEAMLGYSYEMYQHMKRNSIRNQRWIQIKENGEEQGCVSIDNISSNFQNIAFLESFSVFMASELKKRRLMEKALYAEHHDNLTDLLSRKSFEDYMMDYAPDQIACVGVVMANLNNIKGINSARGFQTGNYFIQQFADILRDVFAQHAIFRLNGDEFLVVLSEVTRSTVEQDLSELDKRIKDNGTFTVSVGFSWDDVEKDLSTLIDHATQAMRVDKKRHYDAVPSTVDEERRKMLSNLTECIENREFEVFLQPKVELANGAVVGAEALIRYNHKEKGYIPPAMFIDTLEKNNLIRYIDLFVFEEVCRQLEMWKKAELFLPVISLNFSRLTLLERDILASVEAIISKYDVDRKYVEIEITESIASMGNSVLYQAARGLHQAGFDISLDDFGTKYTNLAILANMNFSVLKVDKSLVNELGQQKNYELIMKNIVFMCKDLGIHVLAEGIETREQEAILKGLQCQMGQGYLYGKPMPMAQFSDKYICRGIS